MYMGSTDCGLDNGSANTSITGLLFWAVTGGKNSVSLGVGVRGEESTTDGEDSVFDRGVGREGALCAGAIDVASESVDCVTTDTTCDPADAVRTGDLVFGLADVAAGGAKCAGLSCRIVLVFDLSVVDVMSVASSASALCRRLDLDAEILGPGVSRDVLSLLLLPLSLSWCPVDAALRMLLPLAERLNSGPASVAVSGGLGGALFGGAGCVSSSIPCLSWASWLRSVGFGVKGDF
jgi:hypothetical protein